jgi:peptidoglycan/xylan/chitin deacetylase (PgdA/CDA1 family)
MCLNRVSPRRRKRWVLGAIVAGLLLVALYEGMNSRRVQAFGALVASVPCADKYVALTLDDGPTPEGTDTLLSLLDRHHARATFFLVGESLERFPEAGARIARAGHELGNHSYSHARMIFRSQDFIHREVERTDRAIRASGYSGEILFRPPFGKKLFGLPWYLSHTGRTTLMWSIEPESTAGVEQTPEGLAAHVARVVKPGDILLMHGMVDPTGLKQQALSLVLERLAALGYRVVGASELRRACGSSARVHVEHQGSQVTTTELTSVQSPSLTVSVSVAPPAAVQVRVAAPVVAPASVPPVVVQL